MFQQVLITADRYLRSKLTNWKKKYFSQGIAAFSGLILTIVIYLINANVLFTFGYQFESNGTVITQCFTTILSTFMMATWNHVIS